jgi:poly(ADP-ribose) glycohydrolase ARH3
MSPARDRRDAAGGALLGTFVGDALGMPFEGLPADAIPARLEMEEARLGRGTFTDDTQMTIALAESLLERGEVVEEALARAFLDAYEPDRGYGPGTRRVFALWEAGVPVAVAAKRIFGGRGSRGNGAAMRVAPVAVRFADDPAQLSSQAARSARLTHAHPVGTDAAVVQAAAIGAALRGHDILAAARQTASTAEMRAALHDVSALLDAGAAPADVVSRLGNGSDARESVCAAIYSASANPTFRRAVSFAVRLGGDTDTVGAMTGAIAGARGGARSIPGEWRQALEDDKRGRSHVERLAHRLAALD